MIPEECTHLAKASFPIAVLSKHSVLEKSMRNGLSSSLHLWSDSLVQLGNHWR